MPDTSDTAPATPELPDMYTPAAQLLALLNVGNRALLSRPTDPLPQALAKLTDYDTAAVKRMMAITDSAGLYALLGEEPETYLDHFLLGQLAYASPLGRSLTTVMAPDESAPAEVLAERRAEVLAYVAHNTAWNYQLMEDYWVGCHDEDDQAEVRQERAELRAAVEAAFAEWGHTLGALMLPAPAPVLPMVGTGWSILPLRVQLDMLSMAAVVLKVLPNLSDHPMAQAVSRLPDFHPQRLEELAERLSAAVEDERIRFKRTEGMLLYIASHVVMVLFVSDVLDEGGLDDLLLNRRDRSTKPDEITPETVGRLREFAVMALGDYVEMVRENEGEEADFQALEARLAPVLALAVS